MIEQIRGEGHGVRGFVALLGRGISLEKAKISNILLLRYTQVAFLSGNSIV